MGLKLEGRDINGMRAAAWSAPDLSPIQSIKVKPNCSNSELLDAIKNIISESVIALRSNNADDKYRNIIDMLMMRIRGSLIDVTDYLDSKLEPLTQFDTEQFIQTISTNVIDLINTKIESNELFVLNPNTLNDLVNTIILTIQAQKTSVVNVDNDKSENTKDNNKALPTVDNKTDDTKLNEDKPQQPDVNQLLVNANQVKQEILDNITTLSTVLQENFKKLESLISSSSGQAASQLKDNNISTQNTEQNVSVQNIEQTIQNNIINVQKNLNENKSKVDSKIENSNVENKKSDVQNPQESSKNKKAPNVFTNKQFSELLKIIRNTNKQISQTVNVTTNIVNDSFLNINKKLEALNESLNNGKISIVGILALVSLILLPMFSDKIVDFIKWLGETLHINELIKKCLNAINWGKVVSAIGSFTWNAIKSAISVIVENPLKWIKAQLNEMWTNITAWPKDIWKWVKDQIAKLGSSQEDNEKKSEEHATKVLCDQIDNLNSKTEANCTNIDKTSTKLATETSDVASQVSKDISGQVQELQNTTTSSITDITNAVQDGQQVSNDAISQTNKNLESTVETASQNVEVKTDDKITASQDDLDAAMNELDKKLEQQGPPKVDTSALKRMEGAAAEGKQANTEFGKKGEVESYDTKLVNDNGEIKPLTASKEEIKKAEEANGKIADVAGSFSDEGSGANESSTTINETTQKNISNKIIVNDKSQLGQPLSFENAANAINAITENSAIITDGLNKSFTLLNNIRSKIEDYFGEISTITKRISDKPNTTHNNAVVISQSGNQTQHNSAEMDNM